MQIRNNVLWPVLVIFTLTAAVLAQDAPLDTIKIDTNLVVLRVAVNDAQGRAAVSLKQEAFKIYEDGVEQPIGFFSAEQSPVSWGLVLDRSGSMTGMMSDVYDAALHVIDEGTGRDETFIVTFNKRTELITDFTSDRHQLENSILGLRADGETALFDAVGFALDQLKRARNRKKVLIVVTDGEDNASRLKFRELIERAEEEEAVIYTVGMFDSSMGVLSSMMRDNDRDAKAELKKLAEVTGASAHFPSDIDQCRSVMKEIAREVSQQYSLGYYPLNKARDGKWRRVQVRVVESASHKYVARTRSGYYARKEEQQN